MPENARRRRAIDTGGPWGTGLFILGVATAAQGINYAQATPAELTGALGWFGGFVPVSTWAVLWVGAGVYSIVQALTPPQRHRDLMPSVFVVSLWAAVYFAYWVFSGLADHDWNRAWSTGMAWAGLAGVLVSFGRCVNPLPRGELDA